MLEVGPRMSNGYASYFRTGLCVRIVTLEISCAHDVGTVHPSVSRNPIQLVATQARHSSLQKAQCIVILQ